MSKIKIMEGPHGMKVIDVYEPHGSGFKRPFSTAFHAANKVNDSPCSHVVVVYDADKEEVADAFVDEAAIEAATAWLLDFVEAAL